MFKRLIILNIVSLFIITIVCAMAVAQEKVKKYTTIKGVVKEIDEGRGTIIIESKREEGIAKAAIRVSKQTKYKMKGTHKLERGNGVSVKCKGSEGEYEAVTITKTVGKITYTTIKGVVKEIDEGRGTIIIERKREDGSSKVAIRASEQTKYTMTGTHKLERGNGVSVKCKGFEGEYEAVAITKDEGKKSYTTIKGVVKEIDEGRGTMIIESKREEGSAKAAIRINKQTKYTVTGTHKLEPGDIVSVKCKGPEGEYEAVSVKEK